MIRLRAKNEAGYAALLVAILFPAVFLGLAAVAVDTARWYVEVERAQKAADAAALAGVTWMPQDLPAASAKAREVAARNGFPEGGGRSVAVAAGDRPSELRVTVTSTVSNTFGRLIGVPSTTISRSAVSDYTGPAPMGSPCNVFGNEPPSQPGAAQPTGSVLSVPALPNCTSEPFFWAAIEGPQTEKVQGDRYSTLKCGPSDAGTAFGCSSDKNEEYRPEGYFFTVKVAKTAVGTPISVQLYDPAFVYTTVDCGILPDGNAWKKKPDHSPVNNVNEFVTTDASKRYDDESGIYCSGDEFPRSHAKHGQKTPPTTTFVLREQTDTQNPASATPISGCTKQFKGRAEQPTVPELWQWGNDKYDRGLAKVFHNWVELCTFTPAREGDYFLQVRTNVTLGGTPEANTNGMIYSGNPAAASAAGNTSEGEGANSFAIRAATSSLDLASSVSVAGWSRMPILQNDPDSTARFNLIRALPGAAGQFLSFSFFDAADSAPGGGWKQDATVRVIRPDDATGSITSSPTLQGCKGSVNSQTPIGLADCMVTVKRSTHDGQVQEMTIPLPADYDCNYASAGGCWFQVEIKFPGNVTDFTTWDASIGGDPVRLVE